jgi:transaldolase
MQVQELTPLARTVAETATDIWNDSCAIDELEYAIAFGAVGATANPTIVVDNWKKDPVHWTERVQTLAVEQPTWTEVDLAWAIVEEMSVHGAKLLLPAFERFAGSQGRLSIQTNPTPVSLYTSPSPRD